MYLSYIPYVYASGVLVVTSATTIVTTMEAFDDAKLDTCHYTSTLTPANWKLYFPRIPDRPWTRRICWVYFYLLTLLKYLPLKIALGIGCGLFLGLFWPIDLIFGRCVFHL